jgi:hypothetical protein
MHKSLGVPRVAAAAVVLLVAGVASAGVMGSPSTSHSLKKLDRARGWAAGDETSPMVVSFDAVSNAWLMSLTARAGRELRTREGRTYLFEQVITPSGNHQWTGWETQILSPGWEWVTEDPRRDEPSFGLAGEDDSESEALGDIGGVTRTIVPGNTSEGGGLIFQFGGFNPNELSSPSFLIRGFIRFVGTDPDVRRERFRGTLRVESQPITPIPAPGVGALMAAIGLAAARRRRPCSDTVL